VARKTCPDATGCFGNKCQNWRACLVSQALRGSVAMIRWDVRGLTARSERGEWKTDNPDSWNWNVRVRTHFLASPFELIDLCKTNITSIFTVIAVLALRFLSLGNVLFSNNLLDCTGDKHISMWPFVKLCLKFLGVNGACLAGRRDFMFACNRPDRENKLTIKFQTISPSPLGFRFRYCADYYFVGKRLKFRSVFLCSK